MQIKNPIWYTKVIIIVAISLSALLGGGYFFAKKIAVPAYREWRDKRLNEQAHETYKAGDLNNAMLLLRKSLKGNPKNADSWRLAVRIHEEQNSYESLRYQSRLADLEPTLENKLHLLRLCIKFDAIRQADRLISEMGTLGKNSVEFHKLATEVSQKNGNRIQAKYHLITLRELEPQDQKSQLDLAEIRLGETSSKDLLAPIRSEIRSIATNSPELRERALVVLLRDAISTEQSRLALELSAQVRNIPNLPQLSSFVALEALRRFDPENYPAYLKKIQNDSLAKPEEASRVIDYLVQTDQAAAARTWGVTLPPEILSKTRTQHSLVGALVQLEDWAALEQQLKSTKWEESDAFRIAWLAFAQRRLGNEVAFEENWKLALSTATSNSIELERLMRQTIAWGWTAERFEVLWRIFQQKPQDENLQRQLINYERSQENTLGLSRIYARLLEIDPQNTVNKNNFAYASLLLNANTARAAQLAREAYEANTKDPYAATTHALALYRQGRPQEALTVLETIDSVLLWTNERVAMHALLLAAVGKTDEADSMLTTTNGKGLLPEERGLITEAAEVIRKDRQQKARTTRISEKTIASNSGENTSSGPRKSWLALLPESIRSKPSIELDLAESLYARDDYKAIVSELGTEKWSQNDYLRLALVAYAQRQLAQNSEARANWKLAVSSTGTRIEQQRTLSELARTWAMDEERADLLTRMFTRDSANEQLLQELVAHFTAKNSTNELARIYATATQDGITGDSQKRARFAYYNLLTGTKISQAHLAARAAYDAQKTDAFAARAYATSLLRQGQANLAFDVLKAVSITIGVDLSVPTAGALAELARKAEAEKALAQFDSANALPEERTLAEELRAKIAKLP